MDILIWVSPSTSKLYCLRMMLTVINGTTCYKDIKVVGGKVLDSFRDACFKMGFFEDDNKYVAIINEVKDWGSSYFLRNLFATMLLSSTINIPRHVWKRTWSVLCDNILYQQRNKTSSKGKCVLLYFLK